MDYAGLSAQEIVAQKIKFGANALPIKEGLSWLRIFFAQFKNPLIYILVIVCLVSLAFGEYLDAALIGAVVLLNSLMGFFQEYNAKKTLLFLNRIITPKAIVIRQGERREIEAIDLVPEDIAILAAGDRVPADGRLLESFSVLANEAILTGEEEAVGKNKKDQVFMGTTIVAGRGIMAVEKIGQETEVGKIGLSLSEIKEEKTPLQKKLEVFTKKLAVVILIICLGIFVVGIFEAQDTMTMFKMAVLLAVAAIPEGLPIAITVILALGMRRVLKRKGLVKNLLAIETLGSTSVICVDKTGTLTEGAMQVKKVDFTDEKEALLALILTNNLQDGLEVALWEYAKMANGGDPQKIFDSFSRVDEEPFDSEKKYSLVINKIEKEKTAHLLGAPDVVISFCRLSKEEKSAISAKIEKWAQSGLKVLAVAAKSHGDLKEKRNYHWLGLVGIEDPLRPGAKEAIEKAKKAGIKTKILTGDYRKTAEKIASQLGFKIKPENILDGKELEAMSEEELRKRINNVIIFSRVSPHQKLKIVEALQKNGEVVAMTGDGVNDAPALKRANIGVVVHTGSDVSKEAGDLILLDNNFETIIAACEEGRLIFANIKKVVGYVLSNSFAEIVLIFGALLLKLPFPLTFLQILWIHLICDGPPDIALGFEAKDRSLMQIRPQSLQKQSIISWPIFTLIAAISFTIGLFALLFFIILNRQSGDIILSRSVTFAILATVDLVYIFAFKDLRKSVVFSKKLWDNKFLLISVAGGFILVLAAFYLPFLNSVLETVPLAPIYWVLVFFVVVLTVAWVELIKFLRRGKGI